MCTCSLQYRFIKRVFRVCSFVYHFGASYILVYGDIAVKKETSTKENRQRGKVVNGSDIADIT